MASGTVTIEKAYFETLLRRAQFHTPGPDFTTPSNLETVTIPKTDHDGLLKATRQFDNLQRNLYRGGIAQETLDILIQDDSLPNANGPNPADSAIYESSDGAAIRVGQSTSTSQVAVTQDHTYGRKSSYTPRVAQFRQNNGFHNQSPLEEDFSFMPDGPLDGFFEGASGHHDAHMRSNRQQYDKFAKRTILLANLPDGTTHVDIVDAVRGGMLLDVYLRTHDRTASVSFLEEAAAQEFFRYVKRYDLYIKGKRVEIRWNERQFILPGHVSNKISIGATRNLVIHNRNPSHTEEAIREDLDHIHNLVVIKVAFSGTDAYVSTNSVHNAMFGRTCLMSRTAYRGSKIEWDVDECAGPLRQPRMQPKETAPAKQKKVAPLMNRFQLLNLAGTDEGSSDDNEQGGISVQSPVSPTVPRVVA